MKEVLVALRDMIQLAYDATQYDSDDEIRAQDLERIRAAIAVANQLEHELTEAAE